MRMKFFKLTHSEALDFILKSRNHILILGMAGTGKTTIVKNYHVKSSENAAIVAPTGIAALNAGGRTVRSFFRFNPRITHEEIYLLNSIISSTIRSTGVLLAS